MKNNKLYKASAAKYLVSVFKTLLLLIFPGTIFFVALSLKVSIERNISINSFFNLDNLVNSGATLSATPFLIMIAVISSLILPIMLYPFKIGLSEERIEIGTRFFGLRPVNWDDIDRIERSGRNKLILYHAKTKEKETLALFLFSNNRTTEIVSYIDNIMKRKRG